MTNDTNDSILSTKQLLIGVIAALLIGAALAIFVVLPAERGEDPTGFGETTGLSQLSEGSEYVTTEPYEPDAGVLYVSLNPATAEIPFDEYGRSLPALDGANHRAHATPFKTETVEIKIPGDGQVEYKAVMQEGEMLLYSWSADGDMYTDFHAHEADGDPDFFTRYSETEGASDSGSIVAAYSGQHGWFWLNLMEGESTVTLTVAGYYEEIIEIDLEAEY